MPSILINCGHLKACFPIKYSLHAPSRKLTFHQIAYTLITLSFEKDSMNHVLYKVQGRDRNFCLGSICVANLLVYTNFYTHTQTHVSIYTKN